MSAMDFNFETGEALRDPRQLRLVQATLSCPRLGECRIVIRNISAKGMGATLRPIAPMVGEQVMLTLPGPTVVSGTVRWVKGAGFGISLDQELDLERLLEAIRGKAEGAVEQGWQVQARHRVASEKPPGQIRRL